MKKYKCRFIRFNSNKPLSKSATYEKQFDSIEAIVKYCRNLTRAYFWDSNMTFNEMIIFYRKQQSIKTLNLNR